MEKLSLNHIIGTILLFIFISCDATTPPVNLNQCLMPGESSMDEENQAAICQQLEPEASANFAVNFVLRDFDIEQIIKMEAAIERVKMVINSKEFKQRVLEHKYLDQFQFESNQGLSNEEVYDKIMSGSEKLSPERDQEADLDLTLYYKNNSTVGYTRPNTERIYINNKFFAVNTYGKVAANIIHEWTHKLGFGHDKSRTSKRNFSVPYGVGKIIQEMIDEL